MWVDEFLRVCMEIEIAGETLFIRALPSLQTSERQWFAAEKSRDLLIRLRDPKGPEHKRYVAPIKERTKDSLLRECMLRRKPQIESQAREAVLRSGTAEPKDESPHAKAEAALETEKLEAEAEVKRIEWVEEALGAYIKELNRLKKEVVEEQVIEFVVAQLTDREYARWSNFWTVACSVFTDEKMTKPKWPSPEYVSQMSSPVMDKIMASILLINHVDEDRLKNLPKERPSAG